jgi:hypothetical protein
LGGIGRHPNASRDNLILRLKVQFKQYDTSPNPLQGHRFYLERCHAKPITIEERHLNAIFEIQLYYCFQKDDLINIKTCSHQMNE